MKVTKSVLFFVLIAAIALSLGALAGWYLYLRSQTSSSAAIDAARGLSLEAPAFGGTLGSTASNANPVGAAATSTGDQNVPIQRLWQVDRAPVSGADFAPSNASSATSTDLYFAERANGYIFKANAQTQKTQRLTNTLIPKVYEAIFAPAQKGVLLRFLDDNGAITTYAAQFSSTTAPTVSPVALSGRYLEKNISQIRVNQKSGALFYLSTDPKTGATLGTSMPWVGGKPRSIFSSTLIHWQVQFGGSQIILTQSPADDMPGYAYTVGSTGALTPLFGPIPGLLVLPHPSEKAFLYSSSQNGTLTIFVQLGKNAPAQLPIRTIAGKCVWAPGKSFTAYCAVPANLGSTHFINDWYQGAVHTADTWWEIDTSGGTAKILYAMPRALDVQDPQIDPSGNYIAFINRSDQSLWMLRIAQ